MYPVRFRWFSFSGLYGRRYAVNLVFSLSFHSLAPRHTTIMHTCTHAARLFYTGQCSPRGASSFEALSPTATLLCLSIARPPARVLCRESIAHFKVTRRLHENHPSVPFFLLTTLVSATSRRVCACPGLLYAMYAALPKPSSVLRHISVPLCCCRHAV